MSSDVHEESQLALGDLGVGWEGLEMSARAGRESSFSSLENRCWAELKSGDREPKTMSLVR